MVPKVANKTAKEDKQAVIFALEANLPVQDILAAASAQFRCLHCGTGRGLIDRLRRRPFACAVIQDQLEDCDCWRLAKIIRSGRFCSPALPVVVVPKQSATPGFDALAKSLNAFVGPLSEIDALPRTIERAIAERVRARILIIEDDPDAAETARRALESDYLIEIAADGAAGLSAWEERRHDLVLLDLMLPALSGEEVLREILRLDAKQPVIIITAHASRQRHSNLMILGANEFVEKPFDINVLRALCRSLFQEIALNSSDRAMGRLRNTMRESAAKASAASVNLKQGRTADAAFQLDSLLANSVRDLTDDEWVEVFNEAGDSE